MANDAFDLALFLERQRDRIVSRFVNEVQRKDLVPPNLMPSVLADHIPKFLGEISEETRRRRVVRTSQDAFDKSETARKHGSQRWSLGYDLERLIREYGVLRHCIVAEVSDAGCALTMEDFDVLAKCLNVGVAEAAAEYTRHRDAELAEQKGNLEFLAHAGQLLSSSLDYRATLNRLTALVVPRLADCCVIHLEGVDVDDMPIAHVDPAKANIVREIYRRYPLPATSPHGYPAVIRTGQAQLGTIDEDLLASTALNDEHLAMLRALGASSWMIVPLRIQGKIFGALAFATGDSKRAYTHEDLALATDLARRAAVAIDNARLYDLSQQERSRVEAATRAKDEFVAMVSHELRTPLNAILGWIRLMRTGTLDEAKRAHAFSVIERNAETQSQLVADLLDISRVLTGKIRILAAQVNLADIVDMAVEGMRPGADAKRIRIDVTLDRQNALLRGDVDRLHQVVWHLLSNAVKFTPKGGAIRIELAQVDSDLVLTVEDNGLGIAPDFVEHVFESFRQSDVSMSRRHGGLGIGLSIARHIVELHGGTIEATSGGVGCGATFVVKFPISALVSTTVGVSRFPVVSKRETANVPLPTGLEGIRALVVDDEPDARELVAYLLSTVGMQVRAAASAAEALAELEQFPPHVILSDIGMPGEDGYALIRRIRTLPDEKKNIPAIAFTAFARSEDRARALVEGFNAHMAKPVEPALLVETVVSLISAQRQT